MSSAGLECIRECAHVQNHLVYQLRLVIYKTFAGKRKGEEWEREREEERGEDECDLWKRLLV